MEGRDLPTVEQLVFELEKMLDIGYRPGGMRRLTGLLTLDLVGGPDPLEGVLGPRVTALRGALHDIACNEVEQELGERYGDAAGIIFQLGLTTPPEQREPLGKLQAQAAALWEKSERTFRDEYRRPLLECIARALLARDAVVRAREAPPGRDAAASPAAEPIAEPSPAEPAVAPTTASSGTAGEPVAPLAPEPPPIQPRRSRRWIPAAIAGLGAIAVMALVAASTGGGGAKQASSTSQPPQAQTGQVQAPPTTSTPPPAPKPPPPVTVGLADLQSQLSWPQGSPGPSSNGSQTVGTGDQVGTVSMSGRPRADAISDRLFSDNSNFGVARIQTSGQYRSISGIAGVNDATTCPENRARLHIEDEHQRTLWGPRTVSIGQTVPISADLTGVLQVNLIATVTRSNPGGATSCDKGDADPAWGEIKFVKAAGR